MLLGWGWALAILLVAAVALTIWIVDIVSEIRKIARRRRVQKAEPARGEDPLRTQKDPLDEL